MLHHTVLISIVEPNRYRTCQTSVDTHPAQPTEARHQDRAEIITTLSCNICKQKRKGPEGRESIRLFTLGRRGQKSSARLEILWL